MDRQKLIVEEQCRQIKIHKWILGEKLNRDPGVEGEIDWVDKSAADFRTWIETLTFDCAQCGMCDKGGGECHQPFNQSRIDFLEKAKNKNKE